MEETVSDVSLVICMKDGSSCASDLELIEKKEERVRERERLRDRERVISLKKKKIKRNNRVRMKKVKNFVSSHPIFH